MENDNIYWQMLRKIWDMRNQLAQEQWLEENKQYKDYFDKEGEQWQKEQD